MFQKTVNLTPAPAVAGDFASANPRASVLAGPGGLVAGPLGVTVGKFAWIEADGITVVNYGASTAAPAGFVHREQQALITTYLAESSNLISPGFPVVLHNAGDFWAKNAGAAASYIGEQVYAGYADGSAYMGAAPSGASVTGAIGATFTATGTGTSFVVTAVTGLISIGDTIAGTGVPAGTTLIAQTAGTTGGAGTYTTSVATTAAAATVTSFGNVFNVTAVGSGVIAVGDAITGTGIPAGANIASGSGGVGVYTIDVPATAYAASTAVTVAGGVLTNFVAASVVAVGELVKISTWGA